MVSSAPLPHAVKYTYNIPSLRDSNFLSNIVNIMFDVSFGKSYPAVKNVSEIYTSKQNMLTQFTICFSHFTT